MADLTYSEIRKILNKSEVNNILLGNGFSVAFNDCFKLNENESYSDVKFETFQGEVAKYCDLERAENGAVNLEGDSTEKISVQVSRFIDTLLSVHPDSSEEIPKDKAKICCDFLSPFIGRGKIFTTNFDMLLNWVFSHVNAGTCFSYNDGFDIETDIADEWLWSGNADVFFCHGALNLFGKVPECFKISSDDLNLQCIRNRMSTRREDCPLCVIGKYSADKQEKIKQYRYLTSCLDSLYHICGNLFVFGFRGSENDIHILKAIGNAQETNGLHIYWGLYDCSSEIVREDLKVRFDEAGMKDVKFFDSKDVPVWEKSDSDTSDDSVYLHLS